MVDMRTTVAAVTLPNPVLTASGCAAAGRELDQFFDVSELGAVVTKSIMMRPRSGRPTPRMAETPSGMLNSIGLQGPGIDSFIENDLAWLAERGRARSWFDRRRTHRRVRRAGRARRRPSGGVDDRGQHLLPERREPRPGVRLRRRRVLAGDQCGPARGRDRVPIFAKLSPDVTDITVIARACADAGADGVSLINTLLGMVIDTDTMAPALGGITGGLSGPAIRPVAVRCVWQVHQALPHLPILGMGGIRTGLDALQFILAGASAVSVGTAVFGDPAAPMRVLAELERALDERGFVALRDAVGYAHLAEDERAGRIPVTV